MNTVYVNTPEISVDAMNRMSKRLVGHGERVAYMLMQILESDPNFDEEALCRLVWTILFHDIGLFHEIDGKTLEDRENDTRFSHAEYGYLFLKYFSPFPEFIDVVRFHHAEWEEIDRAELSPELKKVIRYIRLVDAADLYGIERHEKDLSICFAHAINERCDQQTVEKCLAMVSHMKNHELPSLEDIHEILLAKLRQMHTTEQEEEGMLRTLINAIDFRSHYTAIHCSIMVKVSDRLGDLAQLNAEERQKLHIGAMLHDLGKISIPLTILESSGKLQGEDWEIMKSHVSITEEILKERVDDDILQIAIRHHETLDGNGYPKQLNADHLTQSQRMVAVADIISALSEERSYKKAFPPEKILEILDSMQQSGKICGEVLGIVKQHPDEIFQTARRANQEAVSVYNHIMEDYRRTIGVLPSYQNTNQS